MAMSKFKCVYLYSILHNRLWLHKTIQFAILQPCKSTESSEQRFVRFPINSIQCHMIINQLNRAKPLIVSTVLFWYFHRSIVVDFAFT